MRSTAERTETESLFAILANESPVGICIIQDGKFCYTNPTLQHNTGYREDELLGRDSLELVVPEDREMARENAIKMLKGELTSPHQFRVIHNDGSIHWVAGSVASVQYRGRQATLGDFTDITEHKQTEEALQAERNKLQSVIGAMDDGLTIQDKDYNIIYLNEPLRKNYGDCVGEKCYRVYEGRDKPCAGCPVKKAFKDGNSHTAERRVVLPSGEVAFGEVIASPIRDAEGKIVSCLEIVRNITERKRTEETLQAEKNKLQSLIDTLDYTITIQDTKYNIIYQNEPSRIASGGDHLGEKCYRAYEGREKVCGGCPVKEAFKDGKSHAAERRTEISGKVAFWENTAVPIRDAGGKIVSCIEIARDITERKQAEEALKLLSSVTEQVSDATTITDADFNITYVNRAAQDLFGYSPEEMLGKHMSAFNAEPLPKSLEQEVEQTLSSDKPWTGTMVKKRKDSSTFLCECHITPLHDDEGNISSYIDVMRDVTERKQAEEALQTERNKLQSLIDALEYTLTIQDKEYNIIFQNELARKTFGDHLGEKCYRAYEGRKKVCAKCPVEKAFQDGKSHTSERRRVLPSGKVTFWEHTANPIRDARGRVISCLALGRNITERKRAEEALHQSEENYRALFDRSLIGTFVLDAATMKVVMSNQVAAKTFGFNSVEETIGINPLDFIPLKDRGRAAGLIAKDLLAKDLRTTHEFQAVTKDGRTIWISVTGARIVHEGRLAGLLSFTDITERKQAEEALQTEKNKLQSVLNAMEDGFSIMDRDYNMTYQNETSKRIWGEHTGEKCYRIYEGRERICEGCPVEKAFKDGKSHTTERKTVTPSGEVTIWENTANPIKDARGEITSCLEIGRNVTELKRQEQALADELTRRRILVDQSLDGIVVLDIDAKVVEANQRFAEMLGYTPEEVRELHTWDWDKNFPPEQILEQGQNVDEKGLHLETKHTRKDGSAIDVDISINAAMFGEQKLIFCVCRDVTERNQAGETLQVEKNKLQSVIDAMDTTLTIHDTEYNIIYQNEQSRIASGGDHLGEKCYRAYHGIEKLCDGCPVEKAFKDGKPYTTENKTVKPSGEVVFWEITANPIRDANGNIIACLELARNITERKEQEQALADELTRRRLLVDQSLDGIVVIDENDKVYEANQRFAEMLGYTPEEIRELHTWDWEKNYSREEIHETGRKADEKGFTVETKHTRKDGSVIDVDISINAAMFGGQKLIFCVCRDVTERKKQEQALADELARRRLLVDKSLDGIVVLDVNANVVEANQRFADMLGYTLEEVRKLHTWDWDKNFPPEKILEIGQSVDEKGLHLETKHTRKDGSVIDVDISISGIMYGGQKLIFCIQRDVTERKKMVEAINLQKAYFQQLFDKSPDAILITDINGKIIQGNKGFEVLFGYSNKEIKGQSLIELIVPEADAQEASDSYQRIADGEVIRKESVRRRKDGSLVDVSILAYPIHSNGKLIGLYGIYSDITERKRAEEALRIAAEEWRETFDSITDAISIHDKDYKILRANKAFAEIFNMSPRQLLNKHCYELHKGEKPISGCPHQQTLATGKPAAAEFYEPHIKKYLLESTSPIFDKEGEVIGTVHITRDITERKQQNERLMMADRLASVGELAAGTAHELNNPLTSVIGFSQLLLEKDVPDDIREDLQLIHSEAKRAAKVTNNLLTFARKQAPVKQLNQINSIIEDVLKLRAYEHKANGIEVKKQLAPNLPEIMVDYFQMQQVFLNIIINAEYFMTEAHKRGTLTITTKKQNDNVRISFADDGPGIPPENLSRLYDPFFTTKEAGKGTGLGLSICHGIVSEHGGQIYAKSQSGKGATISVELPFNSHDHTRETP
jgi:PAS domain S-box-containing protein